jgi:hypothetical protein
MPGSNSSHSSKSHFAQQVAAKKSEVQSFFNEDWSRLRTLIMEFEEDSWSDDSPGSPADTAEGAEHVAAEAETQTGTSITNGDNGQTSDQQRPPVRNRLSELAAQIERRLELADGNGR